MFNKNGKENENLVNRETSKFRKSIQKVKFLYSNYTDIMPLVLNIWGREAPLKVSERHGEKGISKCE